LKSKVAYGEEKIKGCQEIKKTGSIEGKEINQYYDTLFGA
jgi:hypothetical protein